MRVDGNPVRVRLDPDRLEADPLYPRTPPGGDEQTITAQLAPVVDLEHEVLTVTARGDRVRREHQLDPVAEQNLAERLTERCRLAGEHVLGHVDHHSLAAEPTNGLRHLHTDRPATEDQQSPRDLLHRGHLAVAPDAVELAQTRHRRYHRIGTVREHHVLGGMPHAIDLHNTRAGEPPRATQQLDAVLSQPAHLPGIRIIRDHEVTPREGRLDVDLRARRRVPRPVDRLAW